MIYIILRSEDIDVSFNENTFSCYDFYTSPLKRLEKYIRDRVSCK